MCRIQPEPESNDAGKYATCARGSDGCECREQADVDGRCNAGLKCADDTYCTVGCALGSLGCACHIEGSAQCISSQSVCRGGRCVLAEKYCDASKAAPAAACALGSLGCCCANGACSNVTVAGAGAGAANEDGSVTTVGAVCTSDRCTLEQVTLAPPAPTKTGGEATPAATAVMACTSTSVEALCATVCASRLNVKTCLCPSATLLANIECKTPVTVAVTTSDAAASTVGVSSAPAALTASRILVVLCALITVY